MIPNPALRREWRLSLEKTRGLSKKTIDAKLAALSSYENFIGGRPFLKLNGDQIDGFRVWLTKEPSAATGERRSVSTTVHTLQHCLDFFDWLSKSKHGHHLDREIVTWFTPTRADKERARIPAQREPPSFEEAKRALAAMPDETLSHRRNQALFSLLLLTGIRADALASLSLGSIDLSLSVVRQDARTVRTKFAKSYNVYFLPISNYALEKTRTWVTELKTLGLSGRDALFPRDTEIQRLENELRVSAYPCWSGSSQVRAVVGNAFRSIGAHAHGPHVMRHMLLNYVLSLDPPPQMLVALSMNFGHSKLETTLENYARPTEEMRAAAISKLGSRDGGVAAQSLQEFAEQISEYDPKLSRDLLSYLLIKYIR